MNETQETAARLKLEALALRHVLTLPLEERADAAAKMDAAALALPGLWKAVARAMQTAPGLDLGHLSAMLDRPALKDEAAALTCCPPAAEALDPDGTKRLDPDTLAEAYNRALEDTARAGELRRLEDAARLVEGAKTAPDAAARREKMLDAIHELSRAERTTEGTLADAWTVHLGSLRGDAVGPLDAVILDPGKRGEWAAWFNAHLGPRGGLEPGRTLIIGGGPAGGKTSLAAALAGDALANGCPVLFHQLELSREETLEHLVAQRPGPVGWWREPFWKRAHRPGSLPEAWGPLLTVPRFPEPEAESVEAALLAQARKTERGRRAGTVRHAVNGLVVVDYAQLLTMASRGAKDAGHEVLATAASRLAKAAGESGAVLVLLSQLTKEAQRDAATVAGTAYHGADLARMAHAAVTICRAYYPATTTGGGAGQPKKTVTSNTLAPAPANEKAHRDDDKGDARLLTWTKTRGEWAGPQGDKRPTQEREAWYRNRALHGGDKPTGAAPARYLGAEEEGENNE